MGGEDDSGSDRVQCHNDLDSCCCSSERTHLRDGNITSYIHALQKWFRYFDKTLCCSMKQKLIM